MTARLLPPEKLAPDAWCHVGQAAEGVARATGLNSIVRQLDTASAGDDGAALAKFREADGIRRQMGCSWAELIAKAGTP